MRAVLIRLYPPAWRRRYGEEFAAILEERPLGPFDVADILLGALDARLRLRLRSEHPHGGGLVMSLRIGGFAAIIGGPLWAGGWLVANHVFGEVPISTAAGLMLTGSIALLVALIGLSAFQARTQPLLAWLAFVLPAIGTLVMVATTYEVALAGADPTEGFWTGLMLFVIGSFIFAIASFLAWPRSRGAATVLGIAIVGSFLAGSWPVGALAGLIGFAIGWVALGVIAVRVGRPAADWASS
jgi:hypothetical protein